MVEALLAPETGLAVLDRIETARLHAPAHIDAEVLSALGRLHRAGAVDAGAVRAALADLAAAPIARHPLSSLLIGAWAARGRHRLVDALYVELSRALGSLVLLTTDARLAASCELAELVTAPTA